MAEPLLSKDVFKELQQDLQEEDIQRGLHRLCEVVALEGESMMFSEAKSKWSSIGARADKGGGTVVERRDGVTLLVVPLKKAVEIAASARSGRTIGDILRSYPGVHEREAPRIHARGGRVWSPALPEPSSPNPSR